MAYKDELLTTICTLEVILQALIKAVKILIEIIGWITIAGGTTLASGGLSFLVYSRWENETFLVYSRWENETVALANLIVGFVIGAIWATRISMKHGTMEWLSGIRRVS